MRFSHIIPEANTEGFRSARLTSFNDIPESMIIDGTGNRQGSSFADSGQNSSDHPGQHESANNATAPTAEELEQIHARAHSEGHSAGYKEGFDQGFSDGAEKLQKELGVQADYLRQLVQALSGSLATMDQQVEAEIAELAASIARQVLQRELSINPEQILDAVRQGIGLLPASRRFLHLYLHGEDIPLVRNALEEELSDHNWKLINDPSLNRGSCRLETDTSELSVDLDQRLRDVLEMALSHDAAPEAQGGLDTRAA